MLTLCIDMNTLCVSLQMNATLVRLVVDFQGGHTCREIALHRLLPLIACNATLKVTIYMYEIYAPFLRIRLSSYINHI